MTKTRRLWWLTVYDPDTGVATRVVGVLGAQGSGRYVSWMPLESAADPWRVVLRAAGSSAIVAVDVDAVTEVADGIILGFIPIDNPPDAPDLPGAVEMALDHALSVTVTERRAS